MIIPSDAIAEFQRLYQQEYGAALAVEEAQMKARKLIELFRILDNASAPSLLSTPLPKQEENRQNLLKNHSL